jgi:hypothetical protein
MAVYVVSDLHGAADELKKAVPEGATLLLLGDLLNLLDYTTMTGILTEVFSIEDVKMVADMRAQGRVTEAREMMRQRSAGREDEIRTEIGRRVLEQYQAVFQALPDPTYLILGNVDNPPLAANFIDATPAVTHVDGQVLTIEGERFGFIGGALPTFPGRSPKRRWRARWALSAKSMSCAVTSRRPFPNSVTTRSPAIPSGEARTCCGTSKMCNRAVHTSGTFISHCCRRCTSDARCA